MKRSIRSDIDYLKAVEILHGLENLREGNTGSAIDDSCIPDNLWLAGLAVLIEDAGLPGGAFVERNSEPLLLLHEMGFTAAEVAATAIRKGTDHRF